MAKRPKRPRDTNQLAKFIVDIATGEQDDKAVDDGKDSAAAALGRKGGNARASKLSKEQRAAIAKKAAQSRWKEPPELN